MKLNNKKSTICPVLSPKHFVCIGEHSIAKNLHIDKFPIIAFYKGAEI